MNDFDGTQITAYPFYVGVVSGLQLQNVGKRAREHACVDERRVDIDDFGATDFAGSFTRDSKRQTSVCCSVLREFRFLGVR
jgi:hypothetical protein